MDEAQRARLNDKQRETFDHLYDRFLAPLPQDVLERMERIVAAASIQRSETVLDVGTGTGALLPDIQRYSPRQVLACDLSGKMLEQVARHHPDVERYQCDIQDLQLPDASVDVVFMNGMFGNIVDKAGTLKNIARMLRPGGRAVISHPEGRAYVACIARTEPFPITPLPSPDEARAWFRAVGMTVTQYTDEEKLLIVMAVKGRSG
jgi:demethylmenaquinone methyltransferase/2-methoxy-6-polyprenyl-1,4-benzoquinol methylase